VNIDILSESGREQYISHLLDQLLGVHAGEEYRIAILDKIKEVKEKK